MNTPFQMISSETCTNIVHSLLHTIWAGVVISMVLHLLLRHVTNPVVRYRLCLGALLSVVGSGLIAWAVLSAPPVRLPHSSFAPTEVNPPLASSSSIPEAKDLTRNSAVEGSLSNSTHSWPAVLFTFWISGLMLMLMRTSWLVLKAQEVRKSSVPLQDPNLFLIIDRLKQRVQFTRKFHIAITDKLTSPAVMGVFLPTLLLPGSLLTSLTTQQLEMIILHELAHIRRGDYFVNVLQLLVESMLYFNPTIWWISQQIRQEREACCDAAAVAWFPNKAGYVEALALIAERASFSLPAPAMAAVRGSDKSSLSDRIHRLLVPHYRPILRTTWTALFGSLLVATALLFLSAVGTRWTVIAATRLLTPAERIERIASTTQKLVGNPVASTDELFTNVSITLTDPSGNPIPRASGVFTVRSGNGNSGVYSALSDVEGVFKNKLPEGNVMFAGWARGFAPAWVGPLKVQDLHRTNHLTFAVHAGFNAKLIVKDASTSELLPGVRVKTSYRFPPSDPMTTIEGEEHVSDQEGSILVTNAVGLPLVISMEKVGYATTTVNSKPLVAGETVILAAERAKPFSGIVVDDISGKAVQDAKLHVFFEKSPSGALSHDLSHLPPPIAGTDREGRFTIDSFPQDSKFWIIVQSPGYTYEVLESVGAGQANRYVRLKREVIVEGRISGEFKSRALSKGAMSQHFFIPFQSGGYNLPCSAPVVIGDDGKFIFTNRLKGPVDFYVGGQSFTQNFTESTNDWNITLKSSPKLSANQREVVFHFIHPSGVVPCGTVAVLLRDRKPTESFKKILEIKNGEARAMVNANQTISCESAETIGYWFPPQHDIQVEDMKEPLIVNIPVIPAGAIYARTVNADGLAVGGAFSRVMEVQSSPLKKILAGIEDGKPSWSTVDPSGRFVANALPLEGKYLIASKLENYVITSEVISLSDVVPDSHVELKMKEGKPIPGSVLGTLGEPIMGAQVTLSWNITNRAQHSIGLETATTDSNGQFVFRNANPELKYYGIEVSYPSNRIVHQTINFEQLPTVVRMSLGLRLHGQLVDKNSNQPLASKTLWAAYHGGGPIQYARTDEFGYFEFSSLEPGTYHLGVEGYQTPSPADFVAGTPGKIVIALSPWTVP